MISAAAAAILAQGHKRDLVAADLLSLDNYARLRAELRREVLELKKLRRVAIGPAVTLHFECWLTLWRQVQEMLRAEGVGPDHAESELAAYAPLVPDGAGLSATAMFEIDDPARRLALLRRLVGVEQTLFLSIDGDVIPGQPDQPTPTEQDAAKASAVMFVRFPFTPTQIAGFRAGKPVVVGFTHPGYGHMALLPDATRQALTADFD